MSDRFSNFIFKLSYRNITLSCILQRFNPSINLQFSKSLSYLKANKVEILK